MKVFAVPLVVVALAVVAPASAQDFLGAFLQAQQDANIREAQQRSVMSGQGRGSGPAKPAPAAKVDPKVVAACQQKARATLRPQYERRARADGTAAANAWLQKAAAAEGRRMGARVAAGKAC